MELNLQAKKDKIDAGLEILTAAFYDHLNKYAEVRGGVTRLIDKNLNPIGIEAIEGRALNLNWVEFQRRMLHRYALDPSEIKRDRPELAEEIQRVAQLMDEVYEAANAGSSDGDQFRNYARPVGADDTTFVAKVVRQGGNLGVIFANKLLDAIAVVVMKALPNVTPEQLQFIAANSSGLMTQASGLDDTQLRPFELAVAPVQEAIQGVVSSIDPSRLEFDTTNWRVSWRTGPRALPIVAGLPSIIRDVPPAPGLTKAGACVARRRVGGNASATESVWADMIRLRMVSWRYTVDSADALDVSLFNRAKVSQLCLNNIGSVFSVRVLPSLDNKVHIDGSSEALKHVRFAIVGEQLKVTADPVTSTEPLELIFRIGVHVSVNSQDVYSQQLMVNSGLVASVPPGGKLTAAVRSHGHIEAGVGSTVLIAAGADTGVVRINAQGRGTRAASVGVISAPPVKQFRGLSCICSGDAARLVVELQATAVAGLDDVEPVSTEVDTKELPPAVLKLLAESLPMVNAVTNLSPNIVQRSLDFLSL